MADHTKIQWTESRIAEIATVVCKHVLPERFCDRGATCSCWSEYALPAAREIAATVGEWERPDGC